MRRKLLPKKTIETASIHLISVYPNPVTSNTVNLQFNKIPVGDYTIELTDVSGRRILQKRIYVSGEEQTQSINLSNRNAQGSYLLRVINRDKKAVYSQKLLVQ